MNSTQIIILLGVVIAGGCIDISQTDEVETTVPSISIEAEVQELHLSNKTEPNPVNNSQTISPDDSVTLKIQNVESYNPPSNHSKLESGDLIEADLRKGARPAETVEIPERSSSSKGDESVASASSMWSEWNNGGFVFKQRSSKYEERKVTGILPGLTEGDIINAELRYLDRKHGNISEITEYEIVD